MMPERRVLGRAHLLEFLGGLESDIPGSSLYLPAGATAGELENFLKDVPLASDELARLFKQAAGSSTGAVVFRAGGRLALVLPPFPVAEKLTADAVETGPLRVSLERDYRIGVVLVRLGSYAVGISEGEMLVSSKVGTGNVHGRHRQGGSSAHRFERHRDKQIEYFLTRVCRHAREHLEPYVKSLDYLACGGARTTIRLLQKQCIFIARLTAPTLPPLLDIPEPRQPVLEDAVRRVYSGTVMEWREDYYSASRSGRAEF